MSKIKQLFLVLKNEIEKGNLDQNQADKILENQFFEDPSILGKAILLSEEETGDGNSLIHLSVINDRPNWLEAILKIVDKDPEKVRNSFSPNNYIRKTKNVFGMKLLPNKIVNLANGVGKTCLHLAAERNYHHHIKILIKFHANLNLLCEKNLSALTCAVEKGYFRIVKILLKADADVNIKCGIFKTTPLHSACIKKDPLIVKTLIKFQANLKAADILGRKVLYFAKKSEHSEIISMLEEGIGKKSDDFDSGFLSNDYIEINADEKDLLEQIEKKTKKTAEKTEFASLMRFSQDRQILYLENKTLEETKKDLRTSFEKLNSQYEGLEEIENFSDGSEDSGVLPDVEKNKTIFQMRRNKNICSQSF